MSPDPDRSHVVLVGLMASGKSTIGRLVADLLELPLVDNDEVLERHGGLSAAQIARQGGVERLHRRELAALRWALGRRDRCVITAAASVADRPRRLSRLLASHQVVLLHAAPEVLATRAGAPGDGDHRRLAGAGLLDALLVHAETRLPVYRSLAAVEIDVGELEPAAAALQVVEQVSGAG